MRCEFEYGDGAQCIAKIPEGKKMCSAHVLLTQMKKDKKANAAKRYERTKKTRPSRAKSKVVSLSAVKKEKEKKKRKQPLYDHTAPWRCGFDQCIKCKNKPTYDEYMTNKFGKRG